MAHAFPSVSLAYEVIANLLYCTLLEKFLFLKEGVSISIKSNMLCLFIGKQGFLFGFVCLFVWLFFFFFFFFLVGGGGFNALIENI